MGCAKEGALCLRSGLMGNVYVCLMKFEMSQECATPPVHPMRRGSEGSVSVWRGIIGVCPHLVCPSLAQMVSSGTLKEGSVGLPARVPAKYKSMVSVNVWQDMKDR